MMTPEEFDRVYFELAQRLGAADDPLLVRDRLLLLLLEEVTVERALALIGQASLSVPGEELKRGQPPGGLARMAHV